MGDAADNLDFRLICDHVPIGIFVLDAEYRIQYWNSWLGDKTGIDAAAATGRRLGELFDGWENERFYLAVSQAIGYSIPHVLSQTLNRYLLPIKMPLTERHGLPLMQQKVSVIPVPGCDSARCALVIIQDVTETVMRTAAITEVMEQFKDVSLRDPLTELFNRRFMWEWLGQQLKDARRHGQPLACLMLDIDWFKRLNDSYGHQRGDDILQHFTRLTVEQLRDSDILVRYGGEEFAAFLPRCSSGQAIATASRILETIRDSSIAGLMPATVTCSIGVAVFEPAQPCSAEELLRAADARLYEAKNSGRNRVCPAGTD